MAAGVYDITIEEGGEWSMTLWLTENDLPKDLTNYQAELSIRGVVEGDLVKKLTSSPAAGITITAGEGKIKCEMTNAETKALAIREGVYDLWLIYTTPEPDTRGKLLKGMVTVDPAVTR